MNGYCAQINADGACLDENLPVLGRRAGGGHVLCKAPASRRKQATTFQVILRSLPYSTAFFIKSGNGDGQRRHSVCVARASCMRRISTYRGDSREALVDIVEREFRILLCGAT